MVPEAAGIDVGIVNSSSRDCCDEGMMDSGEGVEGVVEDGVGEDVVEGGVEDGAVEGGTLISFSAGQMGSRGDKGSTSSYPDPPSDSTISGAPSIESRRVRVVVATLTLSRGL